MDWKDWYYGVFVAFPDEADIQIVQDYQLLKNDITAIYLQSEIMQWRIDRNVVKDISNELINV